MYTLVWSRGFARSARAFINKHPDLRGKFAAVLRDLESNPFQPHLKYHHLRGIKGIQAVSITYRYRITLTIVVTDAELILLDVGSHDEVYRRLET
jgi:mRNA-degrading endonuclease YafQ of YafQ-DinJ toxin-antitoxin module